MHFFSQVIIYFSLSNCAVDAAAVQKKEPVVINCDEETVLACMQRPSWPVCRRRPGLYAGAVLAYMPRHFWPVCRGPPGLYAEVVLGAAVVLACMQRPPWPLCRGRLGLNASARYVCRGRGPHFSPCLAHKGAACNTAQTPAREVGRNSSAQIRQCQLQFIACESIVHAEIHQCQLPFIAFESQSSVHAQRRQCQKQCTVLFSAQFPPSSSPSQLP